MKGLLSRHDVTHGQVDVFMALHDHRRAVQSVPVFDASRNAVAFHQKMPVIILSCEPESESIVFCVGSDGAVTRAPKKEFGVEYRPLLDRALVIGGPGPVQYDGENAQQYRSISCDFTVELRDDMSAEERSGVHEIVTHSVALGAHLSKVLAPIVSNRGITFCFIVRATALCGWCDCVNPIDVFAMVTTMCWRNFMFLLDFATSGVVQPGCS